ncbi:MAG: thiamine biosynthesis protein ThiF [Acidobacteria bacterium]|nr:MAG: thiamine biosynthesis protein ThiF [Acidobacteriota bacterium]
MSVDLSFTKAARVMADRGGSIRFALVGCGGTGSFLAPLIARLSSELIRQGRDVDVLFIDHDRVEDVNIPRQNFCHAEVGLHKCSTLAARFQSAWNVPIRAICERFDPNMLEDDWGKGIRVRSSGKLNILIGCVDNSKARRVMQRTLHNNIHFLDHNIWWLDCGNSEESGQVLLGSAPDAEYMMSAFKSEKVCKALPSPALQAPDLLKTKPEEKNKSRLSCAELVMLNSQSLTINQDVAAVASRYLLRMTTGKALRYFATYFDQESGQSLSKYVTPEEVARVIKRPVEHVMTLKTMKSSDFVRGRRRVA